MVNKPDVYNRKIYEDALKRRIAEITHVKSEMAKYPNVNPHNFLQRIAKLEREIAHYQQKLQFSQPTTSQAQTSQTSQTQYSYGRNPPVDNIQRPNQNKPYATGLLRPGIRIPINKPYYTGRIGPTISPELQQEIKQARNEGRKLLR